MLHAATLSLTATVQRYWDGWNFRMEHCWNDNDGENRCTPRKAWPSATWVFTAICTCTGWDWTRPLVMTALQYFMWGGNGGEPSKDTCTSFRCAAYQSRSRSLEKGLVTSTYSVFHLPAWSVLLQPSGRFSVKFDTGDVMKIYRETPNLV